MAWVRIHDGAMGNLKIMRLSNSAFRLWIRGLCYCQTHLTDGLIPREALKFLDAKRADVEMLASVLATGKSSLWERIEGFGFKVHDYLDWNDSREVIEQKRAGGRKRVQQHRGQSPTSVPVLEVDQRNALRNAHTPSGVALSGVVLDVRTEQKSEPPARRDRDYGRIFLHAWQQQALIASLGPHANDFLLDDFIAGLSALADAQGVTFPNKDIRWAWVQAQLAEEVRRRGLPVAAAGAPATAGKQTTRLAAALANIRAEAV